MGQTWATYSSDPPRMSALPIRCLGVGAFSGHTGGFRRRRLRSYGAVVVSRGSGRYYPGHGFDEIVIGAPSLIWLFPGVEHGYGPDPDGWQEHWVLFGGPSAPSLEEIGRWQRLAPVVSLDAPMGALEATFGSLRTELGSTGPAGSLRASAACYSLVAELSAQTATTTSPNLITRFADGAARRMSMSARAAALGLDVTSLRALILATTGTTPLQYLIEHRLTRAQSLLAETNLGIVEISRRVGFDDPAYFSRQFTNRRGESPSVFRRLHQRADGNNVYVPNRQPRSWDPNGSVRDTGAR